MSTNEATPKPLALVWVDLETTGLDPENDSTLAMGVRVTGPDLVTRGEFEVAIWQPEFVLETMHPSAREMHTKSGLLDRVRASVRDEKFAEDAALGLLDMHAAGHELILAGNSVHFDRGFLRIDFPEFSNRLHYRHFDVSVFKTLARIIGIVPGLKVEPAHTPLADLDNSAHELADGIELLSGGGNYLHRLVMLMRAADRLAGARRNLAIAAGTPEK